MHTMQSLQSSPLNLVLEIQSLKIIQSLQFSPQFSPCNSDDPYHTLLAIPSIFQSLQFRRPLPYSPCNMQFSPHFSLVPRPRPQEGRRIWHTSSHFLYLLTRQFRILDYQSDYKYVNFHVTTLYHNIMQYYTIPYYTLSYVL